MLGRRLGARRQAGGRTSPTPRSLHGEQGHRQRQCQRMPAVRLMSSDTSHYRSVWAHATIYGLLAAVIKLIIDPWRLPSPLVAGVAAFLISAAAYRARLAPGRGVTVLWGADISAATGLLTPLLM